MPVVTTSEAAGRLAKVIESTKPTMLSEISSELFPMEAEAPSLSAADLARHVRSGLAAEELVDLWNVIFPADCNVWYDEENEKIHYNEDTVGYAKAD